MSSIRRPKVTDTEEDVLAEHQQFCASDGTGTRSTFKPAAKVVKSKREEDSRKLPLSPTGTVPSGEGATTVEKPVVNVLDLIGEIKEKHVNFKQLGTAVPNVLDFSRMQQLPQQNTAVEDSNTGRTKTKSLFKQERMILQDSKKEKLTKLEGTDAWARVQANFDQFNPLGHVKSLDLKSTNTAASDVEKTVLDYSQEESCSSSSRVKDDAERSVGATIHPLLAGYSEADILQARRQLLAAMKPETKEYILSRKVKNTNVKAEDETLEFQTIDTPAAADFRETNSEDLPIDPDSVRSFPHMDLVETKKLEWTLPVPKSSSVEEKATDLDSKDVPTRSARFDFKGRLVTEEMEKDGNTWNQALHNHGEEMNRAGYTMEELFTLARSQLGQQRAVAFSILADIFNKSHNGEFDLSLDKSLFHVCNEMDIIHVLRVGMDCTDAQSVNAAINCLSAMLYPIREELSLDSCYLWPNASPYPWISASATNPEEPRLPETGNPSGEEEQSEQLKDYQFVRVDLIDFLIERTDILTRCTYLLCHSEISLNESGVLGILKILIRIARHSPDKLIERHDLLRKISANFMTSNWTMIGKRPGNMVGIPLPLAVKVFRVLVNSSHENARKLYTRMNMFTPVMSYLAYDQWLDQNHVMEVEVLILESFKLWDGFLTYGFGTEEYSSFFPILMNFLHLLRTRDTLCSFDLNHAAHLFSLMEKLISLDSHSHWGLVKDGASFVAAFVIKLLAILRDSNVARLYDNDLSIAAVTKGLQFIHRAQPYQQFPGVISAVKGFVESSVYSNFTKKLATHSLILSKLGDSSKEMSKYPSNMSPCTAVLYGGFQTPIVDKGTPFHFLTVLLRIVQSNFEITEEIQKLILDTHVRKYLNRISTSSRPMRNNIFLRFELYCCAELIKFISPSERLALTYKLLPQIQNGDHHLAKDFIRMFIEASGYSSVEETNQLYTHFLIKGSNSDSAQFHCLDMKLLPYDWIVEPLNILHQRALILEKEKLNSEQRSKVLHSLQECTEIALNFLQYCLSEHASVLVKKTTHIAAIYSRIVLVFMMGNGLFLEKSIHDPLKRLAELLVSKSALEKSKVFSNFNKMPGFATEFSTFYGELLTEFSANSFADEVFVAYMLIPLRSWEASALKIMFWNDESISYIRVTQEPSIVPLEYFAQPETDPAVLQVYRNTLQSGRVVSGRNSLLYNILKMHMQTQL